MTTATTVFVACGLSTVVLFALGLLDPKRTRSRQNRGKLVKAAQVIGTIAACAPGLWLLVTGEAAFFLIWMGFVTIAGWVIASVLPQPHSRD